MIDDGDQLRAVEQDDEQQDAATGPNTPSGGRYSAEQPPIGSRRVRRPVLTTVGGLVTVALILLAAVLVSVNSGPHTEAAPVLTLRPATGAVAPGTVPVIAPRPVDAVALAALPQATTFGSAPNAPRDPAPDQPSTGRVVHPADTVPVFASPGREPVAAVPPRQLSSDTWLPVLAEQPGWALVGLPLRPNGSAAWMHLDNPVVTVASTPFLVTVDRAAFELTLTDGGREVGRWKVGIGKPQAVTPAGRTFLLASIRDTQPTFSSIVLPLGAHSDTYETYGGGPGTAALHTWPTADVYGTASSDGCVRVPPDALQVLTDVPLGTTVLIK